MKRPLSLLEVVIGLALASILLTALFSSYRHLTQNHLKITLAKEELHPQFVMQLRLNQIFERLKEDEPIATKEDPLSQGKALQFTIKNGVDPDPSCLGDVECKIFLNREKSFVLHLNNREEVFLKNIHTFSMRFYDSQRNEWSPIWEKGIPSIIQLRLNEQPFTFFISKANQEVIIK